MKLFTVFILTGYLMSVWISFVILDYAADNLKKRYPSLINKRCKRALWLLSCLLFLPIIIIFPFNMIKTMINFISDSNNK